MDRFDRHSFLRIFRHFFIITGFILFYSFAYAQSQPIGEENTKHITAIPFAVIEKAPAYPGCEGSNEEIKQCTSQNISEFVNENFNSNVGKQLGLSGMNRVIVQFIINAEGKVENIKSRAPHPKLEEEAISAVSKLPVMKPGEQRGNAMSVAYSLPIVFQIDH